MKQIQTNKDLIMLFSEAYKGVLFTREAYSLYKHKMSHMDVQCHQTLEIAPEAAALLPQVSLDDIMTVEDLLDS